MKTLFLFILSGVFAASRTQSFVEFLMAYIPISLVVGFVSFAFSKKKSKKENPPEEIVAVVVALELIESTAYESIQHDNIRFRKGSCMREVEGLGIVSVEIDRKTIIRKIHSLNSDLLVANWVSGWLAKHRGQVWQVHEIEPATYFAIIADY